MWVPTILDFGVGDVQLRHKLIEGTSRFVLACCPRYQHTEHIHIVHPRLRLSARNRVFQADYQDEAAASYPLAIGSLRATEASLLLLRALGGERGLCCGDNE
jgi:hypothetical protein